MSLGPLGQAMIYVFTFHDVAGEKLGSEERRCASDVRAVVLAAQMLRDDVERESVEVVAAERRLVRTFQRSDFQL